MTCEHNIILLIEGYHFASRILEITSLNDVMIKFYKMVHSVAATSSASVVFISVQLLCVLASTLQDKVLWTDPLYGMRYRLIATEHTHLHHLFMLLQYNTVVNPVKMD